MEQDFHHHNRVPSHSSEAEQAVLGAVLRDNRALGKVKDTLRTQDFYLKRHQTIYSAMLEMADINLPIDLVTLTEHLRTGGQLEKAGGASHLWTILDLTPTADNARHYASIIRDRTKQRSVQGKIDWLQEITANDHGFEEDLEAILSDLLRDVRQGADPTSTLKKVKEQAMATAEHLNENIKGLPTGFPAFFKSWGAALLSGFFSS